MPTTRTDLQNPATLATITIAVLAILFAMREAKTVVVPALLAFFLAAVADSPVSWLERKGMSRLLAVPLVVTGMTLLALTIGVIVGSSLQELSEQAPAFQQKTRDQLDAVLAKWGGAPVGDGTSDILDFISPDAALGLAAGVLTSVRDLFGNAFLILFLTVFMLFEVPSLKAKLKSLGARRGAGPSIAEVVRGYLVIKTLTSLATGLLIGLFLTLLSVDFAALWGLLAFLLNYIPSIGSFVASIPPVLLTLLQNQPGLAILVAVGFLAVNVTIGNGIEPRVMGQGLGLSTLVVFLSLILWGWLLGPVGMLLAVPLTTTVKIALEGHQGTRSAAVLLGAASPPASPNETNSSASRDSHQNTDAGGGTRTPTPEGGGF